MNNNYEGLLKAMRIISDKLDKLDDRMSRQKEHIRTIQEELNELEVKVHEIQEDLRWK